MLVVSAPLARGVGGVENPKPDKVMVWVGGVGISTHAPTPQPLYGGGSSALAGKPQTPNPEPGLRHLLETLLAGRVFGL